MNQYKKFAKEYDSLMHRDVNYNEIADYIENLFDYYDINPKIVCDLACGTGNITIPLAKRGYDMIGVDKSFDMLEVAREKAEGTENILFLNQDMSKLDLYGSCGAFVCMIDGINYMIAPAMVDELFYRVKNCFLDTDGIFIFDISSAHKLKNILGNNTFVHDEKNMFYVWENKFYEKHNLCRMDISFFKKHKNTYRRFDEVHLQKAYSEAEICAALRRAGFSEIDTYSAFTFDKAKGNDERIVFCAR